MTVSFRKIEKQKVHTGKGKNDCRPGKIRGGFQMHRGTRGIPGKKGTYASLGEGGCFLSIQQEQELTVGGCAVHVCTLRRLHRVREVPVLEVIAAYPALEVRGGRGPDTEDLRRFNEGCRAVGEAFVAWAMDGPAAQVETAYRTAEVEAANRYRFVRRELSCRVVIGTLPYDGMPIDWNRAIRKAEADGQTAFCLVREAYRGLRHREGGSLDRAVSLWLYPALAPVKA
jgi:hypothetical protein